MQTSTKKLQQQNNVEFPKVGKERKNRSKGHQRTV